MKLISLNVGMKIDNSKPVSDFLNEHDADIIALQEVMRHFGDKVFQKYRSKHDIDEMAGKNYPYKFFGPMFITDVHKRDGKITKDFGGMVEQGNEVLSKFPVIDAENIHYYRAYGYKWDFTNWEAEDHPRSFVAAELDIGGQRLHVITIHGLWTKDKMGNERTMPQCLKLLETASRKKIPTIIAGDFNLLPETEEIKGMSKKFRNLIAEYKIKTTIPDVKEYCEAPGKIYDYIFVNDMIEVKDFKVVDTPISDHMPLILEFDIKKKK